MGNNPTVAEVQVEFAGHPDDSPLRCAFGPLSEKDVTQRLSALERPERTVFDTARGRLADSVTFQPCLGSSSQDHFVVKQLEVQGQRWTFTGVFNGAFTLDDSHNCTYRASQATLAMPLYRTLPTTCPSS